MSEESLFNQSFDSVDEDGDQLFVDYAGRGAAVFTICPHPLAGGPRAVSLNPEEVVRLAAYLTEVVDAGREHPVPSSVEILRVFGEVEA